MAIAQKYAELYYGTDGFEIRFYDESGNHKGVIYTQSDTFMLSDQLHMLNWVREGILPKLTGFSNVEREEE
jgi:hypothetical protein